jgi:hypothetical protein
MGDSLMFYTYIHATPKGDVFYVGKGVKDRLYSKSDRSIAWRNVVKNARGYSAMIAADWSTEEEAFSHETLLISCFKDMGCNLVNTTSGGRGPNDYCVSEKVRKLKSQQMTGYVHKKITCTVCGTSGGEPVMKRWHFDKCKGSKQFRARTTINGKRVFLGNHASAEIAAKVVENYLRGLI